MKIALFGSNQLQFGKVYTAKVLEALSEYGALSDRINFSNLEAHREFLADCEIGFATWGMPKFSEAQIKEYMPKMKALFYSAGTVQYFARPFLNCGVRIFSAFAANAVPVAEYTFSQIVLAQKGYFQSAKRYRLLPLSSLAFANSAGGNFDAKVGLVGLGTIGGMVAQKLKAVDAEVYAYDPFVSEEKAAALGVKLVSLETLFSECDVISNHLANKKELKNIFSYSLFKKMKKHATFINTGRGAQVSEWGLMLSLLLHPSHTAVLDVLKREFFPYINPLFWTHNAVITPHIAGSTGREPQRMAYYMMNALECYLNGAPVPYEVTAESLEKMA